MKTITHFKLKPYGTVFSNHNEMLDNDIHTLMHIQTSMYTHRHQ